MKIISSAHVFVKLMVCIYNNAGWEETLFECEWWVPPVPLKFILVHIDYIGSKVSADRIYTNAEILSISKMLRNNLSAENKISNMRGEHENLIILKITVILKLWFSISCQHDWSSSKTLDV